MTATAQTTEAIQPDFGIPDEVKAAVGLLLTVNSTLAEELADKLFAAGLPEALANGFAVDCLTRQSCELAMYTAIALHNRTPSRERWIELMGRVFDQSLAAREVAAAAFSDARHE